MTTERKEMLHDAFGAPAALGDDDRSFAQQMSDLGVEIVKPLAPKPAWYEPDMRRNAKTGLRDKISMTKNGITIGGQAIIKMGVSENSRLKIGTVKRKNEMVLLFKLVNDSGLKITRTKANSYRVGTRRLSDWLQSRGAALGRYSLKKLDGGWLAIPEGGGGR